MMSSCVFELDLYSYANKFKCGHARKRSKCARYDRKFAYVCDETAVTCSVLNLRVRELVLRAIG